MNARKRQILNTYKDKRKKEQNRELDTSHNGINPESVDSERFTMVKRQKSEMHQAHKGKRGEIGLM